jgi:hypothetical protein
MNYKDKYLKYKKKYLKLKKGGELVSVGDISYLDKSKFEDNYHILSYHGEIDKENYFDVPDNIYLIISDCCGVSNYAIADFFYFGIEPLHKT